MAGPTYPPDSLYYMREIEPPAADTGGVDFANRLGSQGAGAAGL